MEQQADTTDKWRFKLIMAFIFYMVSLVMAYIFCITFLKVPDASKDLANIALGFLLGNVLGVCVAYILVGSPDKKTQGVAPGTQQSSIEVTKTQTGLYTGPLPPPTPDNP